MEDANEEDPRQDPIQELWQKLRGCIEKSREQLIELADCGERRPERILEVIDPVLQLLLALHLNEITQADRDQLYSFVSQRVRESAEFPKSLQDLLDTVRRWFSIRRILGDQGQSPHVPPRADAN